MARLKLTSQELKRKKGELRRFERYLPTLVLKKLQLQLEVNRVRAALEEKRREENELRSGMEPWISVLGEEVGLEDLVRAEGVVTRSANVAGVDVPVFETVVFAEVSYDLYVMPLWVDPAVETLNRLSALGAEAEVLKSQLSILEHELRVTIQRVNLFEKIMIPGTREQIRAIQVFLGDQQAASVVRGKIAKKKAAAKSSGEGLRR